MHVELNWKKGTYLYISLQFFIMHVELQWAPSPCQQPKSLEMTTRIYLQFCCRYFKLAMILMFYISYVVRTYRALNASLCRSCGTITLRKRSHMREMCVGAFKLLPFVVLQMTLGRGVNIGNISLSGYTVAEVEIFIMAFLFICLFSAISM